MTTQESVQNFLRDGAGGSSVTFAEVRAWVRAETGDERHRADYIAEALTNLIRSGKAKVVHESERAFSPHFQWDLCRHEL